MARVAKSLIAPEHGYPHREHRSRKGRSKRASWQEKGFLNKYKKKIEKHKLKDLQYE